MATRTLLAAVLLSVGIIFFSGTAKAAPADVNCNKDTIADTIAALPPGPAVLTILGTCVEDLLIIRDDLTLKGAMGAGGTVSGTITIDGARRVKLQGMTIRDGTNGITATDGAVLRAEDVIVTGAGGYGVGSFLGAVVVLTGVDINSNGGDGVLTFNQAIVDIREGSNISSNGGDGVGVFNGSIARIRGAAVQNNAGYGVRGLGATRVTIQSRGGMDPLISGNTNQAVRISDGSSCRITDATISSSGSTRRALNVGLGSSCTVFRSTLTSSDPASGGVMLVDNGSAIVGDTDISHTGAGGTALLVGNGASVDLFSEAAGNTLEAAGVGSFAVDVFNAGVLVQDGAHDTIEGDINIFASSHVQFQNATITGEIEMNVDSFLRLRNRTDSANTVVNGDIVLGKDSLLEFRKSPIGNKVVVNGNVFCFDDESSVSSVGGNSHTVTGGINCTGFEPGVPF